MSNSNHFANLTYQDFRELANKPGLSKYERIGFPDSYRENAEEAIFNDIKIKLTNLEHLNSRVLDIGSGCSDLPCMLIELSRMKGHRLTLLDSKEMLDLLPSRSFIEKKDALFPNCIEWIKDNEGKFDVILCYSVLHYVLVDASIFRFFDAALSLLRPGGQLLIGDIPNISRRKRFFSSDAGIRYHKTFMKTNLPPVVTFNQIEWDQIDDAILFGLVQRARVQGFDAYVLPQDPKLPMANRREDLFICRP